MNPTITYARFKFGPLFIKLHLICEYISMDLLLKGRQET